VKSLNRHREPFDAAWGVAQDKLPLGGSEAIQSGLPRRWRSSQ
jgi:hypothetical protein